MVGLSIQLQFHFISNSNQKLEPGKISTSSLGKNLLSSSSMVTVANEGRTTAIREEGTRVTLAEKVSSFSGWSSSVILTDTGTGTFTALEGPNVSRWTALI